MSLPVTPIRAAAQLYRDGVASPVETRAHSPSNESSRFKGGSNRPDTPSEQAPRKPSLAESRPWEKTGVERQFEDDIPKYLGKAHDAPIWTLYNQRAKDLDEENVKAWNDGINFLMLFAALFSAVVTAFLALSLGWLQTSTDGQSGNSPVPPAALAVVINLLWILSLTISLYVAVLGMLVQQWLQAYTSRLPSGCMDRTRQRHFRYVGLQDWRVPAIIDSLPLLLHIAVASFFAGFLVYLWTIQVILAAIVTAGWGLGLLSYLFLAIGPLIWVTCPYRSPLTAGIEWFCALWTFLARHSVDLEWVQNRVDRWICDNKDALDAKAFLWLESTCEKEEDKENVLYAFFGWTWLSPELSKDKKGTTLYTLLGREPPAQERSEIRRTIHRRAHQAVARLTKKEPFIGLKFGQIPKWNKARPAMIKLAIFNSFCEPGSHPPSSDSYGSILTRVTPPEKDKLLAVVLTIWYSEETDLEERYAVAAHELAILEETPSCSSSQLAWWLLFEHSTMLLERQKTSEGVKKVIIRELLPAILHLLAMSVNMPPLLVSSVQRLCVTASNTPHSYWSPEDIRDLQHVEQKGCRKQAPSSTTGLGRALGIDYHLLHGTLLESWELLLHDPLPLSLDVALKSYLVHNIECGVFGLSAVRCLEKIMGQLRGQRVLYPERDGPPIKAIELPYRQHASLKLGQVCWRRTLEDVHPVPPEYFVGLLSLDPDFRSLVLPFEASVLQDSVCESCLRYLCVSSPQPVESRMCNKYRDEDMAVLLMLVVWAASFTERPHFNWHDILDRQEWKKMFVDFGYHAVIRSKTDYSKNVERMLLNIIDDHSKDSWAQLLQIIADEPWKDMHPDMQRLLPPRASILPMQEPIRDPAHEPRDPRSDAEITMTDGFEYQRPPGPRRNLSFQTVVRAVQFAIGGRDAGRSHVDEPSALEEGRVQRPIYDEPAALDEETNKEKDRGLHGVSASSAVPMVDGAASPSSPAAVTGGESPPRVRVPPPRRRTTRGPGTPTNTVAPSLPPRSRTRPAFQAPVGRPARPPMTIRTNRPRGS